MPLPTHYKNPFIMDSDIAYRTHDIFSKLTFNDLNIIPLRWIHIREYDPKRPWTKLKERRIISCDTRYPIVIYESQLDPEKNNVTRRYCIFDGNHRAEKLLREGASAAVCFIMKPEIFDGLKTYSRDQLFGSSPYRTTGCGGCRE
tara:strand:- start:584 stop:1018 length:435 start_codon:yes stop_codon:yes gene_type:complete